ncbi:basic salivary proline-rich protein 2-like [Pieris napi]|uniref:basic salivary proline-rich protein 2-like n=1 Tax=Pieris napi TaxID=78633 RepID=UPI001FB8DF17|nr:basic salivary proline-rich protein 2-like [Pieris napi]
MEEEYNMDTQDSVASDTNRNDGNDSDTVKSDYEFGYDESYEEEDGGFRGGPRGRGNFRGRGGRGMPPPGWMNGPPPMRFRGRGYGPGGPPMRGRGFFRGRGGPRFGPNGGPNFDNNWGPMGPPPPGMMGPPPFGPPPPGMMPPGGPMGPPPNMMGQPPPFGPPGMPPPNMPPPEIWVETKSDEGKSYYYHQRTRETTWTRPQESPTCKVITQAEMEAMVSAGQMPGMNQQTMGMNNPMGGPMGGPMGMMPNGMMGGMMPPGMGPQGGASTPNSAPPYMTHPPPWAKDGNNQMKMDQSDQSTMDMDELPPGESLQNNQMPNAIAPVTTSSSGPSMGANMGSGPPMGGPNMGPPPNMGGPGGGTWNPWGWGPPPMVAQPGFPGPDNNGQTPMGANQMSNSMSGDNESPIMLDGSTPPPKKEATVIPPELEAAAAEWTSHVAPDGRMYYHHAGRAHSVWIKPEPLQRLDELKAKIAVEKGERLENLNEPIILDGVIDVDEHADAAAAAEATVVEEKERTERERIDREKAEREREEREKAEKEKVEKEKAKPDKTRPVTSTPITGTPW